MHPSLDGPRAKIERAQSQTNALRDEWQRFFSLPENIYRIAVAELDPKRGRYPLYVQSGPSAFPDEWGVLIGEIAHNLRSALDGLAWQLALLNTSNPYDRMAFPIYLIGRTKRRRRGGRGLLSHFWSKSDGLRLLQSIDRRFWTRLEMFQPYKRGNRGRHSPLYLLQELNNSDKHRLITVVTAVPSTWEMTGHWGGGGRIRPRAPLYLNAKVGYVPPLPAEGILVLDRIEDGRIHTRVEHEVRVNTTITPGILFGNSCDTVKGFPIIRTLQNMANEVSRIVESFAAEF